MEIDSVPGYHVCTATQSQILSQWVTSWHGVYGLELVKQGAIWRVGNGAQIRAWCDPWIPRDSCHLPRSPQGRCRYRWVADFLLPDGAWNMTRLLLYFQQDDIEEIVKIKTSRRNDCDFIAWHPEKRGSFTVRSAYRLALHASMQQQDRGASSVRPDGARPSWNIVWKCQVPPKVKTLAWKICRNAISTQTNMARRSGGGRKKF
jgi:hypothetical protein